MKLLYRLYARVFARPVFYRFNRELFRLSLRGLGILNWETEQLQGEHPVLKRLLWAAPRDAVVVDVGANVGRYARSVLASGSNVELHCFEPSPFAFARLSEALAGTTAHCNAKAVGTREGTITLYDHAESEGSGHATLQENVVERIHGDCARTFEVPIIRLDSYIAEKKIDRIYWLKIDVEGREADVLRGLGSLLSDGFEIQYVQIEFNEMNVLSKTFLEDICQLLPGYRVYRILPSGRLIDISHESIVLREIFAFQNLIFSREELKRKD